MARRCHVHARRALVVFAAVLVSGGAGAQASPSSTFVVVDSATVSGQEITLKAGTRLDGPNHRTPQFRLSPAERRCPESACQELGGALVGLGRRVLNTDVSGTGCLGYTAVVGAVSRSVAQLQAVHQDGTVTPVPRRPPPARWRFKGYMVGKLVHGSPVLSLRARDRSGRIIGVARFFASLDCAPR